MPNSTQPTCAFAFWIFLSFWENKMSSKWVCSYWIPKWIINNDRLFFFLTVKDRLEPIQQFFFFSSGKVSFNTSSSLIGSVKLKSFGVDILIFKFLPHRPVLLRNAERWSDSHLRTLFTSLQSQLKSGQESWTVKRCFYPRIVPVSSWLLCNKDIWTFTDL